MSQFVAWHREILDSLILVRCRLSGRRIGKPVGIRHCPRNGKSVEQGAADTTEADETREGVALRPERPRLSPETSLAERQTAGDSAGAGSGQFYVPNVQCVQPKSAESTDQINHYEMRITYRADVEALCRHGSKVPKVSP